MWNLSDSTMAADSSNYHRVGTTIRNNVKGRKFAATFTVNRA